MNTLALLAIVVTTGFSISLAKCPTSCGDSVIQAPTSGKAQLKSPGFDGKTNYCPNLKCKWLLSAPAGHKLQIDFLYFNVDVSDSLYLYDGDQPITILKFLSGNRNDNLPEGIISSGQSLLASFTTNQNPDQTAPGFLASVKAVPVVGASTTPHIPSKPTTPHAVQKAPTFGPDSGPDTNVGDCQDRAVGLSPFQGSYHFWTPGFPGPYSVAKCLWYFNSPENSNIILRIVSNFSTERGSAQLSGYAGNGTQGAMQFQLTGFMHIGFNLSLYHMTTLEFVAASNPKGLTGFHAEVYAVWKPSTTTTGHTDITTEPTYMTTPGLRTTSQDKLCGSMRREVSGPLETGRIQSPNFPLDYPNNIECVWNLVVPFGYRLNLSFTDFDLQDYSDFLTVWAGYEMTENAELGRFTGSKRPYRITSTYSVVTLRFTTSYANSRRGFAATFTASNGRDTGVFDTSDRNGALLQTPKYPSSFPSWTNVRFDITVNSWQGIQFDFKRFHTDSVGKVRIYKHHSMNDGDKIREYTGNYYNDLFLLTACTKEPTATFYFESESTFGLGGNGSGSEPLGVLAYYTPIDQGQCIGTVSVTSAAAIAAYVVVFIIELVMFIIAIVVFANERREKKRAILAGYPLDTSIPWNTCGCLTAFIISLLLFMPFTTIVMLILACVSSCQRRKARKARAHNPAAPATEAVKSPEASNPEPAEKAETCCVDETVEKKKKHKKKVVPESSSSSSEDNSSESEPPTPKPRKKHHKRKHAQHSKPEENTVVNGFVVNPSLLPRAMSPAPPPSMYPSLVMEPQNAPVLAYPPFAQPSYTNPSYQPTIIHSRPMSPVQQVPVVHQPVQFVQQPVPQPQVSYVQQAPPPAPVYQQQAPVPQVQMPQQIQVPQPQQAPPPHQVFYQQPQPVQQPAPPQIQNPPVMHDGFQNQAPPATAPNAYPMTTMASYYGYTPY